jgi:ribonucleoside-triphosphate reductase
MRNLEAIEKDLAAAREALSSVKGTPAEVYSRIVGYYRSVRNWNLGKRKEYGERRLYRVNGKRPASPSFSSEERLLLFVRSSCPRCPPARDAAGKLGIPVDFVNTDTSDGMAEAVRHGVLSTPTAILLSQGGKELKRATDAETIGRFYETGSAAQGALARAAAV